MRDALELAGKVVIVTGGGRGVGRGISDRFLEAGARVVICGRREPETLPSAGGSAAEFIAADVRELDQIDRVVSSTVDRHGQLDVLVNNAGGSPTADAATASPRFASSILSLNLVAPLNFAQGANAAMQTQDSGGTIINIAPGELRERRQPAGARRGGGEAGLPGGGGEGERLILKNCLV